MFQQSQQIVHSHQIKLFSIPQHIHFGQLKIVDMSQCIETIMFLCSQGKLTSD